MNTCAVTDVAMLQQGDHICIWDTSRWPFQYTHHGIVIETGACGDAIAIAHMWSFIDSFRASQTDSSFRRTSLTAFLNGRPLAAMRRVQYNSSLVGTALATLGEVHRAKSDIPPVVLARCAFLLGLGRGHFRILSLNCEHVALWCKTGVVWSKQLFHKASTRAPFLSPHDSQLLVGLDTTIARLQRIHEQRNDALAHLHGRRVYLQLVSSSSSSSNSSSNSSTQRKFVKRLGDALYAVPNDPQARDWAFRHTPTPFVLHVAIEAVNSVTVMLADATTAQLVCAKARHVKLLTRRAFHRASMFTFELTWRGELQSRRHRRWYVGAQTRDGLLRTFNQRDKASRFEIVDAAAIDAMSVAIDAMRVSDVGDIELKERSTVSQDDDEDEDVRRREQRREDVDEQSVTETEESIQDSNQSSLDALCVSSMSVGA